VWVGGDEGLVAAATRATVADCELISLRTVEDRRGSLTIAEAEHDIPFPIRRVYYLYDVPPGGARGGHAHRCLHQVLVAAAGGFDVVLDDGAVRRRVRLQDPQTALYIPPGVWREMDRFTEHALCFVLASEPYDASDYLRDYREFLAWRRS
jgi:dTDP-4-dehydrorhamnose 3,5-epimerase-like enzyme